MSAAMTGARRPLLEVFRPVKTGAGADEVDNVDPALEAARAAGIEEGRRVGFLDGRAAAEADAKPAIEAAAAAAREEERLRVVAEEAARLCAAADAIEAERQAYGERFEEAMRRTLAAVVEAVAPRLAQAGLAQETARAACEGLARAVSNGEGRLRVHPEAAEELEAAIAARRCGAPSAPSGGAHPEMRLGAAWIIVADPSVEIGEARAEWRDGMAELDLAGAARAALDAALRAFGAAPNARPSEAKPTPPASETKTKTKTETETETETPSASETAPEPPVSTPRRTPRKTKPKPPAEPRPRADGETE